MNPFTKGAKVHAVVDTESYGVGTPIPKGTVVEVSRTNEVDAAKLFNAVRPDGGEWALAKDHFEPNDTTPAPSLPTQASDDDGRETAPLDPGAVKAGDTVTVRFIPTGEEFTTKAYRPDDVKAPWVYLLGWPLIKGYDAGEGGTFGLALKYFELLAHEPAAEPDPEWADGTPGTATVNNLLDGNSSLGMRVMRVTDGFAISNGARISDGNLDMSDSDFVPDEPTDPEVVVDDTIFRLSEVPAYAERLNEALREATQRAKRDAIEREGKVLIDPETVGPTDALVKAFDDGYYETNSTVGGLRRARVEEAGLGVLAGGLGGHAGTSIPSLRNTARCDGPGTRCCTGPWWA